MLPAGLHHQRVNLHQVNVLNFRVMAELAHHAAVAGPDNQHVAHGGMHGHRRVGNHLVVNELIPFGQHHIAVQGEEAAKLG